uniref:Uncharacterized protein n=1 Tax=Ditylenchus dipsaci TaxID=166011 RepID=A0A915ERR6_9BILA
MMTGPRPLDTEGTKRSDNAYCSDASSEVRLNAGSVVKPKKKSLLTDVWIRATHGVRPSNSGGSAEAKKWWPIFQKAQEEEKPVEKPSATEWRRRQRK